VVTAELTLSALRQSSSHCICRSSLRRDRGDWKPYEHAWA